MLETVQQRNTHLTAIEKARNSAIIAYVLHDNAMIADDAIPQIYDKLQALGRRDRIDLLVHARGGIPEATWRVLNLVRDYCDHLAVIVAHQVHGPASLLALGADEIVMGPLAELGSVELPRKHPLLPRDENGQLVPTTWTEIASLLGLRNVGSGTEDAGAGVSPSVVPESLYGYIHPLALASIQQADRLNRDLTRKALELHASIDDSLQIERIVDLFNGGFHSPMFTANRDELRELGLNVTRADDTLWKHIAEAVQLYHATIYNERPDSIAPGALYRYVCMIESVGRCSGLHQTFMQTEAGERVVQIGWETAVKGPGPGPNMGAGGMSNN
ncbi:MAG TPA: hypothetical protein VEX13_14500 [Chloroflexia bacterium]|nr:hypothetical protein [Chloroflexia bacterium]